MAVTMPSPPMSTRAPDLDDREAWAHLAGPMVMRSLRTVSVDSFDQVMRRCYSALVDKEANAGCMVKVMAQVARDFKHDAIALRVKPPEGPRPKSLAGQRQAKRENPQWSGLITALGLGPEVVSSADWMDMFRLLSDAALGKEKTKGIELVKCAVARPDVTLQAIAQQPMLFRVARGDESFQTAFLYLGLTPLGIRYDEFERTNADGALATSHAAAVVRALEKTGLKVSDFVLARTSYAAASVKAGNGQYLTSVFRGDLESTAAVYHGFASVYGYESMAKAVDHYAKTAVMAVFENGSAAALKCLIDLGHDIKGADPTGMPYLKRLVLNFSTSAEMVRIFIQEKAYTPELLDELCNVDPKQGRILDRDSLAILQAQRASLAIDAIAELPSKVAQAMACGARP